ncbi:MAG: GIY-YIG nuclease family protein [Cyanobacteria bacterium J06626_6]
MTAWKLCITEHPDIMNVRDLSQWRSCRLEDRKALLPKSSGIYAVLSKNKVMYIGRSNNLNKRWRSGHHRYAQATRLKNPKLAWISVDKSQLSDVEAMLIRTYSPAWNWTKVKAPRVLYSFRTLLIGIAIAAGIGCIIGWVSLYFAPPVQRPNDTESQ